MFQPLGKMICQFFKKLKKMTQNLILRSIPKGNENICQTKNLYSNSIIQNNQKVEATQIPVDL
jgi:hypothetical protein